MISRGAKTVKILLILLARKSPKKAFFEKTEHGFDLGRVCLPETTKDQEKNKKPLKNKDFLAPPAGIEPTTCP